MKRTWLAVIIVALAAGWAQGQQPPPAELPPGALAAVTRMLSEDLEKSILQLNEVLLAHPDMLQRRGDDFALVKLGLEKTRMLLLMYSEDELRNKMARESLDEARKRLELFAADKPFPPDGPGLVEKAYLSQIDDSAQPYFLYRPEKLDLKKPVPLILFLHGYVGHIDKVTWFKLTFPEDFLKIADQTNAMVLVPFARSNTDFQGIGEKDVLDTIAKVLATTPADPDRVFLGGVSMGGSGVWTVASHNPDVFAGAFPIAGRTDYYLWKSLKKAEVPRFEQFLIDKEFSITFPQNFINLPVRCYHTREDILVSVDHSREMAKLLEALRAPIYFKEFEKGNHWDWDEIFGDQGLWKWIRNTKRERFPETVRFKALELRHNRDYWVSIDRIDRWGTPAEVLATRMSRGKIRVGTKNVGEFTLRLDPRRMRLAPQVTIEVNGKEQVVQTAGPVEQKFTLTEPGKLCKRQGLCGPYSELLEHRFMMVLPTQGDAQAVRRDQELWRRSVLDWQGYSTGLPRMKRDADVNDGDIAGCNLILFGTPATNAFLARIADKLPIRFEKGNYVIGKQTYPDSLGLIFIYPNPLNPDKMVAVCSGQMYGDRLASNHKYDLIPDYIVFEDQPDADDTNWFRCAGMFDSNWQLDGSLMETRGPAPVPPAPPTEPAKEPVPQEKPAPEPQPAK